MLGMPSRVSCKGCKRKRHHTAMKDTYPWYGYDGFVTGFDLTNEDFDGDHLLDVPNGRCFASPIFILFMKSCMISGVP